MKQNTLILKFASIFVLLLATFEYSSALASQVPRLFTTFKKINPTISCDKIFILTQEPPSTTAATLIRAGKTSLQIDDLKFFIAQTAPQMTSVHREFIEKVLAPTLAAYFHFRELALNQDPQIIKDAMFEFAMKELRAKQAAQNKENKPFVPRNLGTPGERFNCICGKEHDANLEALAHARNQIDSNAEAEVELTPEQKFKQSMIKEAMTLYLDENAGKGLTRQQLRELMNDPSYFALLFVHMTGAIHYAGPEAEPLRNALLPMYTKLHLNPLFKPLKTLLSILLSTQRYIVANEFPEANFVIAQSHELAELALNLLREKYTTSTIPIKVDEERF